MEAGSVQPRRNMKQFCDSSRFSTLLHLVAVADFILKLFRHTCTVMLNIIMEKQCNKKSAEMREAVIHSLIKA